MQDEDASFAKQVTPHVLGQRLSVQEPERNQPCVLCHDSEVGKEAKARGKLQLHKLALKKKETILTTRKGRSSEIVLRQCLCEFSSIFS